MTKEKRPSALAVLGPFLRRYLKPNLRQVMLAVVFMVIGACATAGFAQLLQPVLDEALIGIQNHQDGQFSRVVFLALMILMCFVTSGVATYFHIIIMNKVSQTIIGDIQSDVFSHLLTLDLTFFHTFQSGQLVSRITNDVGVMRTAVADGMTGIGKNLLTLILLVGVMFNQDWRLALITVTVFPFATGLVTILGRRLRKLSKSIQSETAVLSGVLTQIFQGIRQVQAYGMEDHERQRADFAVRSVRNLNIKAGRIGNLSTPLNELLIGLVIFGIIVYGGHQISVGALTPGGLLSFIGAFSLSYEPMKRLAKLNNAIQLGIGAAERITEMTKLVTRVGDRPGAMDIALKSPSIHFNNVEFHYNDDDDIKALNGVSFDMPPGKVTALVGPSGSGKTTVMNLLLRFYDPTSGTVTIDGTDLRDIKIASLRRNMALVSQDITIFDDTLYNNILYGDPTADETRVREAAKAAAAEEFIARLPEGYETRVGENGVKLSGGQKQRIALARAILRNAPILLLDEATSALDNESERLIQSSLATFQKGRTTLVIAHRLSTVQHADQIIVMHQGQIAEQGTHDALINRADGIYARMHKAALIESA